MTDVFISYKAEEFNEANWVKTTLETNGISCWMAPMSIPGGSNYALEIPQAIKTARVFVLILSERSQLSRWIPRELDQAINEGKTILPFMLENCPLRDDFNFYLSNIQRYTAYENKAAAIEKMIREIRAIIGASNAPLSGQKETADTTQIPVEREPADRSDAIAPNTLKTNNKIISATVTGDNKKQPETAETGGNSTVVSNVTPSNKTEVKKDNSQHTTAQTSKSASAGRQKTLPKERKTKNNKKKLPRWVMPVAVAALAAILVFAGIVAAVVKVFTGGKVTIAGEKYRKDDNYVTVKEKNLSEKDIQAISEMKELDYLYLTDCSLPEDSLKTIFAAASYGVQLDNCGITGEKLALAELSGKQLRYLVLDNNPLITDLSAISPLKDTLKSLSFNNCAVTDISLLSEFTLLEELRFDGNSVTSLEPLNSLEKLKTLSANNNGLTSLDGLEKSIWLESIQVAGNQIESIEGLKNTSVLNTVNLARNRIENISVLSKSAGQLKTVNLSNNKIDNISALKGATMLTSLCISGNSISSFDAISSSKQLTHLEAAGNQISDITVLSNFKKLIYLDLSGNLITQTASICFDPDYQYGVVLDLSNNEIHTLFIPSIKYKYLALYGNEINNQSSINKTNGSHLVIDYNKNWDYDALSKTGYFNYYVFDCPLDKQVELTKLLGSYYVHFTTEQEFDRNAILTN